MALFKFSTNGRLNAINLLLIFAVGTVQEVHTARCMWKRNSWKSRWQLRKIPVVINRQIRRGWWYERVVHSRYKWSQTAVHLSQVEACGQLIAHLIFSSWDGVSQFYRSEEQRPFFPQPSAHVHAVPDISYRGQARAGMCCRSWWE